MSEGRTLVRFATDGNVPEGLPVDADECLWLARFGAGCVGRVGPDGAVVRRVDPPVPQATSCTFGGEGLGDLFIPSGTGEFGAADLAREPLAVALSEVGQACVARSHSFSQSSRCQRDSGPAATIDTPPDPGQT